MLRAFYEQENNFGVTDRINIYDNDFSGSAIQLEGRAPLAFDFEHREITSEQKEYLSIFGNQIVMGVLNMYLRIDTPAKESIITELSDSPTKQFRLEWVRGGEVVWVGYPYGRTVDFQDRPNYNVKIQFRDFEFLKGEDYPLQDIRRTIRQTLQNIIGKISLLGTVFPIRTATSWQAEGTDLTDDFLNVVYHDTFALRDYASGGYQQDQQISYYEALERTADPMLILYQWKGVNVYQISALNTPSSVLVSKYNLIGQFESSNQDVRQTINTSFAPGNRSAKVTTSNTSYPAIRRVLYDFIHRSGSIRFEFDTVGDFPPVVDFDGSNHFVASKQFAGSGDERLNFLASYSSGNEDLKATFAINVGEYAIDSDYQFRLAEDHTGYASNGISSIDTTTGRINLFANEYEVRDPVMFYSTGSLPGGIEPDKVYYITDKDDAQDWIEVSETPDGATVIPSDQGTGSVFVRVIKIDQDTSPEFLGFSTVVSFLSGEIPAMADATLQIILIKTGLSTDGENWNEPNIFLQNPTEAGTSIEYRLTQDQIYPDDFRMRDSYFGDGPFVFSKSSYRRSLTLSHITTGWRRRGQSVFIPYSQLKLREVLDYQRKRQLKKNFNIVGEFDPISVSVYEGDNYMYVGGRYNGRWSPVMVKIEENNA